VSRIGLVVHGQPPELVGGTERLVADLARSLAAAGETVEVFSGSIEWREHFEVVRDTSGPVPVVRVHRHDLFFERWDKLHDPFVERAYLEWIDDFRPDLVHIHHWARLTTTLVQAAADRGVPAVLSLHDLFASCPRYHRVKQDMSFCTQAPSPDVCRGCAPSWSFQADAELDGSISVFVAELRAEVARAAALLAPTEGHGRRVLGWLGLSRDVLALPPGGSVVPAPATRPLGDRQGQAGDPLRVGLFGHLHPLKGVGVALDALVAAGPDAPLALEIWGAAPDAAIESELKQRAAGLDVTWHGSYEPGDLSGADIDAVMLPSLCSESYSFALDEAGALGVPIVASDLGALADRATARVKLVPRGDGGAFATALLALADDPDERDRMRSAPGPQRIDAAEHLARLTAVYDEVREAPRPKSRPVDPLQLAQREHLFALREAGLKELLRSEGWEAILAQRQAEIDALRSRL
jgi:glycosyltransferase involved in cell wall biosynthesis